MTFEEPDGATPLEPDELEGLKFAHVTTRGELDELEQANIEQGLAWISRRRGGSVFDDGFRPRRTSASIRSTSPCSFACSWMMLATGRNTAPIHRSKPPHGFTTAWCKSIPSPTAMAVMHGSRPTSCSKTSTSTRRLPGRVASIFKPTMSAGTHTSPPFALRMLATSIRFYRLSAHAERSSSSASAWAGSVFR